MAQNIDLHQEVTDQIIAAMEAGASGSRRWLTMATVATRVTGDEYRGINALILALIAQAKGYANPTWMTFNQAKALGGSVRKGEKSAMVIFYKDLAIEEENDAGEAEERRIPLIKQYRVFNVEQIDGLPEGKFPAPIAADVQGKHRDDAAELALRSSGARIIEGGNQAYYHPASDTVHLPRFEAFTATGLYLATMAHELVHWTGADHRLNRPYGRRFGDKDYAFEELVAEIGAAFVCARLGVAGEHIDDHAAYVGSWLKALRGDKKFIFKAAAQAQAAADRVLAHAGDADRLGKPTDAPRPIAAPIAAQPTQLAPF
jgi:antirestriction protein ArdC